MATPKISKKKKEWVDQFKPSIIKGAPIANNASVSEKYHDDLKKLIKKMTDETMREILELYKSPTGKNFFTEDASIASQARILMNSLQKKFNEMFGTTAQMISERMVKNADKTSRGALAESMKDLAGMNINTNVTSADMMETMKASIAQNVDLIKSIPEEYFKRISGAVYRSITSGQGLGDLVPMLKEFEGITERRAKTIALDQTRKAYQSITADRVRKLGVKKFEWVHTAGSRFPRQDHMMMNGNIYSFDDLPVIDERTGERGLPGQAPNCRCIMRPVIEFDDGEQ